MNTFEPFVVPTNRSKIVLPDFDTTLKLVEAVPVAPNVPEQSAPKAAGPKKKKTKVQASDVGIDIEMLRKSDKKQGYSMPQLKEFAKKLNKAGYTISITGVKKGDLAQSIVNALED